MAEVYSKKIRKQKNFYDWKAPKKSSLYWFQARTKSAATCLTFKTPPAASLYAGIPQILFFGIYKIQSPSLCFGILRGIAHKRNPTLPNFWTINNFVISMKISSNTVFTRQDLLTDMVTWSPPGRYLLNHTALYCSISASNLNNQSINW